LRKKSVGAVIFASVDVVLNHGEQGTAAAAVATGARAGSVPPSIPR
jgi:hypothetical protein